MKRLLTIIGLLMLMILTIGCHERDRIVKNPVKIIAIQPLKKPIKPQINRIKKPAIVIPEGFHPIKLVAIQTSDVGSVDHPTIDGGIINSEVGLSVMNSQSETEKNVAVLPPPINQTVPFEDSWARSKEVKSVLDKAIAEGKLSYVMKESSKRGLPASVAIIPIVESHYSEHLVSPKGAAGIWQIMPSLANDYHLKVSERFNFKKSTQVALDHIEALYSQFGNWELTFAAYNAGNKRVIEALHHNPKATSIDELSLPFETKAYLAKIKLINRTLISM